MTALRWADATREKLTEVLPDALVVLPIGAIEQHGRHLATGADALLAQTIAVRAADTAATTASRPVVLAPTLAFGASDHHLPFGGTLSLTPETLLALLLDLMRSVAVSGGTRAVLVNGHGGNVGICHAAAAAASTRHQITVAHLDYWQFVSAPNAPGHAGEFETSLVTAVRPDVVGPVPPRRHPLPAGLGIRSDVTVHDAALWAAIDGYSDHPERADTANGTAWLDEIADGVAQRLCDLAETL